MNIPEEVLPPSPQRIAGEVLSWMLQIESEAIAVATVRPQGAPSDHALHKILDVLDCKISRLFVGRHFNEKNKYKDRVPFFGVIEGNALCHSLHAHLIFYGRGKISYLELEKVFEQACGNFPSIEDKWIEEFDHQKKAGAMTGYMLKGAKYIGVDFQGLASLEFPDRLFFSPALAPYTRTLETPGLGRRCFD